MDTDGATAADRRLSGLDSAFLYLERKEIPLHIAGVFLFDGPIPFDEFVRSVQVNLRGIPRYRQVVVVPPYNAAYPTWEDDPQFDIGRHIFREQLRAPGGEAELEELTGRILSPLMDRSKPLWDIHVVEGLKDGRGALILRVHHSLADGIAGAAAVMRLIMDPPPGAAPAPAPRRGRGRKPEPPPGLAQSVAVGVNSSLGHLVSVANSFMEVGRAMVGDSAAFAQAAALLPEIMGSVERLPFNKPCSGERGFCWGEFDMAEVKAIRNVAGGTVNDVVLAVLTRAIARYVELHGQSVSGRLIRVICPVNLRRDDDKTMGNQITFLPVSLPMDVEDPLRMVGEVAVRTALMKRIRAGEFVAIAAGYLGLTPPAVQAMMWRGISDVILPLPLFNIICTNIPGSREPLFCVGRRLLACYPQVPTGYELGVNFAVLSYCGKLQYGLISDVQVVPDATRLRDFLNDAFDELCRAAGVRKARRRRPAKPRARTATPAPDSSETAPPGSKAAGAAAGSS